MNDRVRLAVVVWVFVMAVIGWAAGGYPGAAAGVTAGTALGVLRWRRRPFWSWLALYLRRNLPIVLAEPVTVANDRSGGGVRYQDGIAVAAVQILGKPHSPTLFTGSAAVESANAVDLGHLIPMMRQSLGLTLESLSVITCGARRSAGDYPRVYDTLVGTPPYAGQRETWLVLRIRATDNGEALRWRTTVGAAALAAAQRIATTLRCRGIRTRVATATDIVELERRLGRTALQPHNRRWNSVRGEAGWLTTYAYRTADITSETLGQAWSLRADGIIQNVTLFGDGTASARVTVRTGQPPVTPPSVVLQPLPGVQALGVEANLCGPRSRLPGEPRGVPPSTLRIPVGPSGVLLGKTGDGYRLALPLGDPGGQSRVHIAAEDAIAKRIVIRSAAAGERVTVHTTRPQRWESLRMPGISIVDHPRPASGSTVSVIDGTVAPAPRPPTVISVGDPGAGVHPGTDVGIVQTGPETVEVTAAGRSYDVTVEFFRAEHLYVAGDAADGSGPVHSELAMAD